MRNIASASQHHAQAHKLIDLMQPAVVQARVFIVVPHPHGVVSGMVIARFKGQLHV